MLRIGFTRKYYTLWDVSTTVEHNYMGLPYQKTNFHYIQNLSMDEEKAIEKAREMGVKDLEVDENLYGRNGSFYTENKLYCFVGVKSSPCFEFGKYNGTLILENDDIDYIGWYYRETENSVARSVLLENKLLFDVDGEYVSKDEVERLKWMDEFSKLNEIEVDIDRNLSVWGYYDEFEGAGTKINLDGNDIYFHFDEVKEYFYREYSYYLPTIDGVGKRIKNKRLKLIGEVKELYIEGLGIGKKYFHVSEFEILK